MSEMVYRVASAIAYARLRGIDSSLDLARIAIEAMREPTDGMLETAYNTATSFSGCWRAMIDEALK